MCHGKTSKNRINNTSYGSKNSISVSVHMRNSQYLATEIFKVKNGLFPIIMKEIFNFQKSKSYNLRSDIHLSSRNMHTAHSVLTLYPVWDPSCGN